LNKGKVKETDLVEVTLEGKTVTNDRKPSMELDMHLFIYQQRSDANAVVHAHPIYATGFATARIPLDKLLLPEVVFGLGAIPLARYATPSTKEVAASIAPYVKTSTAILLENHGVVTFGKDLDDAFFKMEKVEHAAHIAFVARLLGGERPLSSADVAKLFATFGKQQS
jgi:L-fuculose-phosphate aldolase